MLFGTAVFFCLFLPIVVVGFFAAARLSSWLAATWLFAASLFYYGYWMPAFTPLLVFSIVVNFFVGRRIAALHGGSGSRRTASKRWLIAGIVFNLGLLAYFKYANFFVESVASVVGATWQIPEIVLPIGISFYTFTQIAFLADAHQKGVSEYKFSHYGLFVTYFPHLIAGPVLHHAQMMPQFAQQRTYRLNSSNLAAGLVLFSIGLAKKIVLADGISPFADAVFDPADAGASPMASEAWIGALAYTFQLYFDFSGYTDMALGVSLMFNIRLPYNFNSPYKAASISDFWRRWHMTLSAFLRDYLYIPLGGNRKGPGRRYVNLLVTMLLGGLWHGASWTFVFWGGLHGLYLALNHAYHGVLGARAELLRRSVAYRWTSVLVTFAAVVFAWVFFRAQTFEGAGAIVQAMLVPSTFHSPATIHPLLWNAGLVPGVAWAWCLLMAVVVFAAPNSNRLGEGAIALCERDPRVRYGAIGAAVTLSAFLVMVNETRGATSAFIYFNF